LSNTFTLGLLVDAVLLFKHALPAEVFVEFVPHRLNALSLFDVHVELGVLDILLTVLGILVVVRLTLEVLVLLSLLFKFSFLEFHVILHSQMNQFVSLYGCVVDLFLGLFVLHLQHADTVT